MKIWKYSEMSAKVMNDTDTNDETFVNPDELTGYFNEAVSDAHADIIKFDEDYFLKEYYLPAVAGQNLMALPFDIYANKIRNIMYSNGATIYQVVRYRRRSRFQDIAFTDQYGASDDYRYILKNIYPGQVQVEFHPALRETAILPPQSGAFTPLLMYYIRDPNRIAVIGELCNNEVVAPSQVNTTADTITTNAGTYTYGDASLGQVGCWPGSIAYVVGDQIQFIPGPGGTLPSPLVQGTYYYVISNTNGVIQISATSGGSAINLTTQGTVFFNIQVACTTAIKNATIIDIPECSTYIMQWVKCRILAKEKSPLLGDEVEVLVQQKKMLNDTLTDGIPDDDNEIQPDFSSYQEMS